MRVYPAKTAANARRFLRDLERAAPMKITRVLTDNGKEFTDRLFGLRRRAATGAHAFDRLCAELGIEHRLAPPTRRERHVVCPVPRVQSQEQRSSRGSDVRIWACEVSGGQEGFGKAVRNRTLDDRFFVPLVRQMSHNRREPGD